MRCVTKDSIWRLESRFENKSWILIKNWLLWMKANKIPLWDMWQKIRHLYLKTRLQFLSKIHSFECKSKQDSILRCVKKDSIWHLDLKTSLELLSKTDNFEWKSKQNSHVRYVTKDSIWRLECRFKNKSWILIKNS